MPKDDRRKLYAPLSKSVLRAVPQAATATLNVEKFVTSSLSKHTLREDVFVNRVRRKHLALKNAPEDLPQNKLADSRRQTERQAKKARRLQRQLRRRSRLPPLTAKERKTMHIHSLPKTAHQYALFLPLHRLWLQYMDDLQGDCDTPGTFAQRLVKADYHGALITVVKAKCPTYVGLRGILISEQMNVFRIITPKNELKHIPKHGCQICFTVKDRVFTLYGDQLAFRASDRATRKFKSKQSVDIV
ncbi:RNase P/RNase MRP complex subunit [Sorochytrium milnesiophthora]